MALLYSGLDGLLITGCFFVPIAGFYGGAYFKVLGGYDMPWRG